MLHSAAGTIAWSDERISLEAKLENGPGLIRCATDEIELYSTLLFIWFDWETLGNLKFTNSVSFEALARILLTRQRLAP